MSRSPDPNDGNARPHGGPPHDKAIDDRIAQLESDPSVEKIRKNQQQMDVNGNKVGTNRPDIQYDKNSVHHVVEFDMDPKNGLAHGPDRARRTRARRSTPSSIRTRTTSSIASTRAGWC